MYFRKEIELWLVQNLAHVEVCSRNSDVGCSMEYILVILLFHGIHSSYCSSFAVPWNTFFFFCCSWNAFLFFCCSTEYILVLVLLLLVEYILVLVLLLFHGIHSCCSFAVDGIHSCSFAVPWNTFMFLYFCCSWNTFLFFFCCSMECILLLPFLLLLFHVNTFLVLLLFHVNTFLFLFFCCSWNTFLLFFSGRTAGKPASGPGPLNSSRPEIPVAFALSPSSMFDPSLYYIIC